MDALRWIAEQKIAEAVLAGELDDVPGSGRPLLQLDDPATHADMRIAYKILKNAGFLPLPLLLRKEIEAMLLEKDLLLARCEDKLACIHEAIERQKIVISANGTAGQGKAMEECRRFAFVTKKKQRVSENARNKMLALGYLYNRTVESYRRELIDLLGRINCMVQQLCGQAIAEEIRNKRRSFTFSDAWLLNTLHELEIFDSRFQTLDIAGLSQ